MLQTAKARGDTLKVAMVIGAHPLFMLAAAARVPFGTDERAIAGGLFGAPLELVRTPRYGIGVPASAEFVLEGTIDPDAHAEEGPFGEFTGYSSDRSTNNVLRVDTMMRRHDAWLVDVVGGPYAEHLTLARLPREAEMSEKLKARFPSVTALHYPNSGTHFHCYVALNQTRDGEARQIMLALLGWDPYLKNVVAVDSDIDITNDSQVLWAIATHFQPHQDVFIVDGLPGSPLDPSSSAAGTTSRMGIDATRGSHFDGIRATISERASQQAVEFWRAPPGARAMSTRRLVVGISGASGFTYGVRLLQLLRQLDIETHLTVSRSALLTMTHETDYKFADVSALASFTYRCDDMAAAISSGSFRSLGMIVAPCSMKTLAEIASGMSSSLISRAADVTLKERRPLVLLARETPTRWRICAT